MELEQSNPSILMEVQKKLQGLSDYTSFEKNYPFVECASWADEIKLQGLDLQSHWHYVDDPIFDGVTKPDWFPNLYNVTWALVSAFDNLIIKLQSVAVNL